MANHNRTDRFRREGDWCKAVGAHYGAVFTGGKWRSFECVYCARYYGRLLRLVQNNQYARRAWGRKTWDFPCEGTAVHRAELEREHNKRMQRRTLHED